MCTNNQSPTSTRQLGVYDRNRIVSATEANEIQSDICYEQFHSVLTDNQREGHRRRESKILVCPLCQSQTDLVITPQNGRKSWIIRIMLILTVVLSCFAFQPCLIDDLKQYEYICITCKNTVDFYRGYEFPE